jgi:hypothetical protein
VGVSLLAVAATADLFSVNVFTTGAITALAAPAAVSAQDHINNGKSALTSHDILTARDQFKLALETDPNNQEANLLYGITRVIAVVEDGQSLNTAGLDSVREILELAGFMFTKFSVYDMSGTSPHPLALATPRTGDVLDFLKNKALPEINGAIANLSAVTNTNFSSIISSASINKISATDIIIDFADALIVKALLHALKCNLELLMVYGLDANLPNFLDAPNDLMAFKQLFQDATFLTPKDSARLTTAKSALTGFIDTYTQATQYLLARSGAAHHLFVIDVPVTNEAVGADTLGLNQFKKTLAEVKASLAGPYLYTFVTGTEQNRFVDLSKFFDAANPVNIRAKLSRCATGTPLPDSTLNGLFPLGLTGYESLLTTYGADLLGVTCNGQETPLIMVDPGSVNLTDNPPLYSSGEVTINNAGTANLSVTSFSIVGANSANFTILPTGTCGATPTLAPGNSCTVKISLNTPVLYQNINAALQIVSTDLSSPRTYVPLQGRTSAAAQSPPSINFNLAITLPTGGNVQGRPSGPFPATSCPGTCTNAYSAGTFVKLAAFPEPGWVFNGWTGCDMANDSECAMNVSSLKTVAASFIRDPKSLTVLASPPGGNYSSSPEVSLVASKDATIYYTLNGSTPSAGSTRYTAPFTLAGPKTLKFIAIDPFGAASSVKTETYSGFLAAATVSVTPAGSGGGTVNSIAPASGLILCSKPAQLGDNCAATLTAGTTVILSATPNTSSLFTGWSLTECSGTGNCSFALGADTAVTATFITMPPVKVVDTSGTKYYTLLQDAYNNALSGATISTRSVTFPESLTANKSVSVTIKGGFDAEFLNQTGYSLLQGKLTIGSGSVKIERLTVK